jgi:hypothetical protein
MVKGIEIFREYFSKYTDQYVLIPQRTEAESESTCKVTVTK